MYQSDVTQFLKDLKEKRPEIAQQQRIGRAMWWDKSLDPDQQARYQEADVPQSAYVYQTKD